jgi:hypothetical protein
MLTCYNLGWLKGIFYNMMNVDHDIFGDIYIYICVWAYGYNKIIWSNRNMENHPRKPCNHSLYGSGLAN